MELIPGMVVEWMAQGVTFKIADEFTPWSADEWVGWIQAARRGDPVAQGTEKLWAERFRTRLGRALAYAELPAIGVLRSDASLVHVAPNAWITWVHQSGGAPPTDQFSMALTGEPIFAKVPSSEECMPMVALSDLAAWAGASIEPEPPTVVPAESLNAEPPQRSIAALSVSEQSEDEAATPTEAALLSAWMNGYARAFKQFNKDYVIQREAAIEAIKQYYRKACSVRAARDAYKDLPYPELRNAPPKER